MRSLTLHAKINRLIRFRLSLLILLFNCLPFLKAGPDSYDGRVTILSTPSTQNLIAEYKKELEQSPGSLGAKSASLSLSELAKEMIKSYVDGSIKSSEYLIFSGIGMAVQADYYDDGSASSVKRKEKGANGIYTPPLRGNYLLLITPLSAPGERRRQGVNAAFTKETLESVLKEKFIHFLIYASKKAGEQEKKAIITIPSDLYLDLNPTDDDTNFTYELRKYCHHMPNIESIYVEVSTGYLKMELDRGINLYFGDQNAKEDGKFPQQLAFPKYAQIKRKYILFSFVLLKDSKYPSVGISRSYMSDEQRKFVATDIFSVMSKAGGTYSPQKQRYVPEDQSWNRGIQEAIYCVVSSDTGTLTTIAGSKVSSRSTSKIDEERYDDLDKELTIPPQPRDESGGYTGAVRQPLSAIANIDTLNSNTNLQLIIFILIILILVLFLGLILYLHYYRPYAASSRRKRTEEDADRNAGGVDEKSVPVIQTPRGSYRDHQAVWYPGLPNMDVPVYSPPAGYYPSRPTSSPGPFGSSSSIQTTQINPW